MQNLPQYQWALLALPDRHFRWRIRGNPLSWYQDEVLARRYDLIIATSMVDLATLKGLNPSLAKVPAVVYFHENQFAFPISQQQHTSVDPQMVNLYSAMAADSLVFNSEWNRSSFISGIKQLIQKLPDHVPKNLDLLLQKKSQLLPVPIANDFSSAVKRGAGPITLVWSARWEYDKGPGRLLAALRLVERSGLDYRLNVIGPQFRKIPKAFLQIEQEFAHRIRHFGYQEGREAYIRVLQESDIFISTAEHEFQGLSALEAAACGCVPLLPSRLSYPEIFGKHYCYSSNLEQPASEAESLLKRLQTMLDVMPQPPRVDGYQWGAMKQRYASLVEQVMASI